MEGGVGEYEVFRGGLIDNQMGIAMVILMKWGFGWWERKSEKS